MKNIKIILCVLAATLVFFLVCMMIFLIPFCHPYKKAEIKLEEVTYRDFVEALDLTNREIDRYSDGDGYINIYMFQNKKPEKYLAMYCQLCEDINTYIAQNPESKAANAIIYVYWRTTSGGATPLRYCNNPKSYHDKTPYRCFEEIDEDNDCLHVIETDLNHGNNYVIQQKIGLDASMVVIEMGQSTTGHYTKDRFEFLKKIKSLKTIVINYDPAYFDPVYDDAVYYYPEEVLKTVHEVMPEAELYSSNFRKDLRKYEP